MIEVTVAVAVLGLGLVGVSALGVVATEALTRARALDESYAVVTSFADSARVVAGGPVSGSRTLPSGVLTWNVPAEVGAWAWVRFEHAALADSIEVAFVVAGEP